MTPEQRDAFSGLVESYYRGWLSAIKERGLTPEQAEDLLHDVLAELMELPTFNPCLPIGQVLTFVRTRIAWRVHDYFQRGRKRESAGGEAVVPGELEDRQALSPLLLDLREEQRRAICQAVSQLSPEHQDVLHLKYWLNLPLAAVAATRGLTSREIRQRLSHARKKLREVLGNDPFFDPKE
jgi:RNA polymerase sigma-70 factor (ECF subfamily)